MPLIKCPECGHMISEFADKCVSCGCPMSVIKDLIRKQQSPKSIASITEDIEEENKPIPEKNLKIYSLIRFEVAGLKYKATSEERQICKDVAAFLLHDFNSRSKKEWYNAVYASSTMTFFGHKLAWNKREGIKSAKIVYCYYKATLIVDVIRKYERIYNTSIITDDMKLLSHLYKCLSDGDEIDCSLSLALNSNFSLIPDSEIDDVLERFTKIENT